MSVASDDLNAGQSAPARDLINAPAVDHGTKRRILFVDDEAMILKGIERLLRPMRKEWEMVFATGAAKAREHMESARYDVIVTDMMMPEMDGAQLLTYVKEHFPWTIRLVLSGHAEQDLAMKCIGVAHQYLAKPCDPAALKSTIARLTEPEFGIRNEQIMTLVTQLEGLPTLPEAYLRMLDLLDEPNATSDDIGAVIAADMSLTAKLLQMVNSSFFGIGRHVSKPSEAVGILGMNTLKTVVVAMHLSTWFESTSGCRFTATHAAEHGRQVGAAARAIALAEGSSRVTVDDSFAAGLLHDIGKLILASSLPDQFASVAARKTGNLLDAEREVFGATHAEVGGYLLGLWGLPGAVVEAVTLHHAPCESDSPGFTALTATHVANSLVRESVADTEGRHHPPPDTEYLNRLGLGDRLPVWRSAVKQCLRNL